MPNKSKEAAIASSKIALAEQHPDVLAQFVGFGPGKMNRDLVVELIVYHLKNNPEAGDEALTKMLQLALHQYR